MDIVINECFRPVFETKFMYCVLYGGAGSGKSHFVAQKLLLDCAKSPEVILAVRKTARTNRDSVFEEFKQKIESMGMMRFCLTDLQNAQQTKPILFDFGTHQSKILFAGLDDVEKVKSIKGVTKIWIEEASQVDKKDLMQLDIRLRDTDNPEMYLSFNPVSKYHWLKSYFNLPNDPREPSVMHDSDKGVLAIWTNYTHNPFLKIHSIKKLLAYKTRDIDYYNIYCLGMWGNLRKEGQVFTPEKIISISEFNQLDYQKRFFGFDYGFVHPSALIDVKYIDERNYACNLVIYEKGLTTLEIAGKVKTELLKRDSFDAPVYYDHSRADLYKDLKKQHINAFKANKKVDAGIRFVKSCNVWAVENKSFEFEFEQYQLRYNKITDSFSDEVRKENDDAMDAMRYAIFSDSIQKQSFGIKVSAY